MLSLIFLKFVSDRFEERRQAIIDDGKADYVDMVEFYTMKNVFYLPEDSRWSTIVAQAIIRMAASVAACGRRAGQEEGQDGELAERHLVDL